MFSTRHNRSSCLYGAVLLALLSLWSNVLTQSSFPPPDIFQPACETAVTEPLVKALARNWIAGLDSRMAFDDVYIAAVNTTPLIG